MLPLLLVFPLLVQLAGAAPTDAASGSPAPTPNPTSSNYRSVWSILGTCALTLIICVWKTSFPNITHEEKQSKVVLYRVALGLVALVTPEITTARAYSEWRRAGEIEEDFRDRGWTRTHGFFALMGGFLLQDGTRRNLLKYKFNLAHLWDGTVVNPNITKEEIRDRSKSDGIGNALFVLQLSWFILQIIARATSDLAITLVEIDTLTLAVLSLPLFFFWWSKPMAVERPHIFYKKTFSSGNTSQDHAFSVNRDLSEWIEEMGPGSPDIKGEQSSIALLLIVWIIFGGLHLIAWDFQFPSQVEKIMWRAASLTLIGAPCIYLLGMALHRLGKFEILRSVIVVLAPLFLGVVARFVLLALMLASLRDLPPSAHETVSWTLYVPHL